MEKLNEKYGLDYFSHSELDSESDEGENIDMNTSTKHSFDRIQTRNQKFYGVYKNSNFINDFL